MQSIILKTISLVFYFTGMYVEVSQGDTLHAIYLICIALIIQLWSMDKG